MNKQKQQNDQSYQNGTQNQQQGGGQNQKDGHCDSQKDSAQQF